MPLVLEARLWELPGTISTSSAARIARQVLRLRSCYPLLLLHTSGFRRSGARLPDGQAKRRILRAVERPRECIPLRAVLRFMRVSPSRFQAWRRRQHACALDDRSSCPRTSPHRLTPSDPVTGHVLPSPGRVPRSARQARVEANRLASCATCPSLNAAA